MRQENRQRCLLAVLWAVTILLIGIALVKVVAFGPLRIVMEHEHTALQLAETAVVFFWNGLWLSGSAGGKKKLAAISGGIFVFTWCHQIFLPLAVSAVYLLTLSIAGIWLDEQILRCEKLPGPERLCLGFVTGSAFWMVLVCGISLTGHGGLLLWRVLALGILAAVCLGAIVWCARMRRSGVSQPAGRMCFACRERFEQQPLPGNSISVPYFAQPGRVSLPKPEAWLLAFILTIILVQAGRLNIELDYDSLHYGLRSPYVLDNGRGIYENLGMINLVYTYSKGLEVLCLPLSGTPTYGFVLGVSFWAGVGTLALAAHVVYRRAGRRAAFWGTALVAAIPGITNMMATAKNDGITLLHQLIIYDFLCLAIADGEKAILSGKSAIAGAESAAADRGKPTVAGKTAIAGTSIRAPWLIFAVSVYFLTMVYKPTALVFSTALGGVGLLFLLAKRQLKLRDLRGFQTWVLPALAVAGLWYRTWLFTGVPVTSIFASLCERIGFQVKYPYSFAHVIGDPSLLTTGEKLVRLAKRLLGMLIAPVGYDMSHVVIAWGTGLVTVMLILWATAALDGKLCGNFGRGACPETQSENSPIQFDCVLIPILALGCIASIYTLYQVDGNYFILFYALLTVSCVCMISKKWKNTAGDSLKRGLVRLAVPLVACNLFLTCLTSWAGTPGFTPVKLVHKGYYNHRQQNAERHRKKGCEALSMLLGKESRVLAFGHHPQVLDFDCVVQSYYDLTGSGGNVALVKTLAEFEEFLKYAGIQYVYIESGYLERNDRARDLVEYMIAEGSLKELRYEWGNAAAQVDFGGQPPGNPEKALEEFYAGYCEFPMPD